MCELCGKTFSERTTLETHKLIHTGKILTQDHKTRQKDSVRICYKPNTPSLESKLYNQNKREVSLKLQQSIQFAELSEIPFYLLQLGKHGHVRPAIRSTWQSTCCRSTSTWLMKRWRHSHATSAAPRCQPEPPWTAICGANTLRWDHGWPITAHAVSLYWVLKMKWNCFPLFLLGGVPKNGWVWWSAGCYDNK